MFLHFVGQGRKINLNKCTSLKGSAHWNDQWWAAQTTLQGTKFSWNLMDVLHVEIWMDQTVFSCKFTCHFKSVLWTLCQTLYTYKCIFISTYICVHKYAKTVYCITWAKLTTTGSNPWRKQTPSMASWEGSANERKLFKGFKAGVKEGREKLDRLMQRFMRGQGGQFAKASPPLEQHRASSCHTKTASPFRFWLGSQHWITRRNVWLAMHC